MAKFDTALPQAAARPLPTPYDSTTVSPDAFGAPVAEAAQKLTGTVGEDLIEAGKRAKANADTAAVLRARGLTEKALNDTILDPEKGYQSLKGDDALAQRDQYLKTFSAQIDAARKTLTNDHQRNAFDLHAMSVLEQGQKHAMTHEGRAIEQVSQASYEGAQIETLRTLGALAGNPLEADRQMARFRQQATAEARRRGLTSADAMRGFIEPEMARAADTLVGAAIDTGNVAASRDALRRVGDVLPVAKKAHYGQVVDRLESDQKVTQAATGIVTAAVDPVSGRIDAGKLWEGARKLDPADPLTPEVMKSVQSQYAQRETIWSQRVGQVLMRAKAAGTDPVTSMFSMEGLSAKDKVFLQKFAPDDFHALGKRENTDANTETPVNRQAYASFLTDFGKNPKKYSGMTDEQLQSLYLNLSTGGAEKAAGQIKAERMREQGARGNQAFLGTTLAKMVHESGIEILGHAKAPTKQQAVLEAAVRDYVASEIGTVGESKTLDVNAVREMIKGGYEKGKVLDTGVLWDDTATRAEAMRSKYAGKQFVPAGGGPAEVVPEPVAARATPAGFVRVLTEKGALKLLPAAQADAYLKLHPGVKRAD